MSRISVAPSCLHTQASVNIKTFHICCTNQFPFYSISSFSCNGTIILCRFSLKVAFSAAGCSQHIICGCRISFSFPGESGCLLISSQPDGLGGSMMFSESTYVENCRETLFKNNYNHYGKSLNGPIASLLQPTLRTTNTH